MIYLINKYMVHENAVLIKTDALMSIIREFSPEDYQAEVIQ